MTFDLQPLLYWIAERDQMQKRREAGAPPYSEDPILRDYRFCNVERERDAVTRWIATHWREPHAADPDVWFAMAVARLTNYPETLAEIGYPVPWDTARERYLAVMARRAAAGLTCFDPAYVVPAGNTPGMPKAQHLADNVFEILWQQREHFRPRPGDTCAAFCQRLLSVRGIATFLAGQIVADVKFTEPLKSAPDWATFAVPGPGSKKGLNYICGRPPDAGWDDAGWRRKFDEMRAAAMPELEPLGFGHLSASDLQNVLCEIGKFLDAKLHGKMPKQRYVSRDAAPAQKKKTRSRARPAPPAPRPAAKPEPAPAPKPAPAEARAKPAKTHQGDLAKLPAALAPLLARPQWAVWRWTERKNGDWHKPPFMALQPARPASSSDPGTWTDYATALATAQTGKAEGVTYVLAPDDPFAAIDLDHCRDVKTGSIDRWAQLFLQRARGAYTEITPSGDGLRIWGLASGSKVHRQFNLEIDGKAIRAELFRRTAKPLTITGLALDCAGELVNIDAAIDWGIAWGERRKAAEPAASTGGNGFAATGGNGFDANGGNRFTIDQIEHFVRAGAPASENRSDLFHAIVGHYLGVGWDGDRILAHLGQFPEGIGGRYLSEGRLSSEVARSIGKYTGTVPVLNANGHAAKAPPSETNPDPEVEDEPHPGADPKLPRLYAHGDPDPRPLRAWLIKNLIPEVGYGLISGQWGTGKTFIGFDLVVALTTGQLFLGHRVKRQSGVLWIAAEGADEVRLRLDAAVRAKGGAAARMPFRWYEDAPVLLQKGAADLLIAMGQAAEQSLQEEFGLPLGLIIIDTAAACAGYTQPNAENDNATAQAIVNVLKLAAHKLRCFVLVVDHLGKNAEAGTRGADAKEASADVVLACLGVKELSGAVTNTRLTVRKSKRGRQGAQHPFTLREVEAPERDEDGELVTTMVVDWQPAAPDRAPAQPDPWEQPRRQDQRTAVLRLKRALEAKLAEQGVELPIPPDGPVVRMIDQEIVREAFYASTPADGTGEQKRKSRHMQFSRARAWAEEQQLIGIEEIAEVTYLRLTRPDGGDEED